MTDKFPRIPPGEVAPLDAMRAKFEGEDIERVARAIAQRRFELSGMHNISGTYPPGLDDFDLARVAIAALSNIPTRPSTITPSDP